MQLWLHLENLFKTLESNSHAILREVMGYGRPRYLLPTTISPDRNSLSLSRPQSASNQFDLWYSATPLHETPLLWGGWVSS
jgi:hypothetical protein